MFPERLNQTRKERGLTAQEVADKVGVALRTYRNYENGTRKPSLDSLVMIADILDVSVDFLLCRDAAQDSQN